MQPGDKNVGIHERAGLPLPAREAALRALADLRGGRKTARRALEDVLAGYEVPGQELALATELLLGVVRHRLTLARVLDAMARGRWKNVNARLQHVLMLGAYQLIWLDSIPAFAAVNEAVKQARFEGGPRAAGFVNAVLRQLLRDIEARRVPAAQADPVRAIPIKPAESCLLHRPVLPDPKTSPIEHLADATSHPPWLVSRWVKAHGLQRAREICLAGMLRPPLIVRPNRLRIDTPGLLRALREEGVTAEALPACAAEAPGAPESWRRPGSEAIAVPDAAAAVRSRAFAAGLLQPQDVTAMEVIPSAWSGRLQPGQVVLDLCAGVGTKSTQIAEMMGDTGVILACDVDADRLALLESNCRRLGLTSVRTVLAENVEDAVKSAGAPCWVLVDAPCSNTGVLARRPEARYRLDRRALTQLADLQLRLLRQAATLAAPDARLLYSTCSIEPEENEQVSARFGQAHPEWRLLDSRLTLPSAGPRPEDWHDGGYWASWARGRQIAQTMGVPEHADQTVNTGWKPLPRRGARTRAGPIIDLAHGRAVD